MTEYTEDEASAVAQALLKSLFKEVEGSVTMLREASETEDWAYWSMAFQNLYQLANILNFLHQGWVFSRVADEIQARLSEGGSEAELLEALVEKAQKQFNTRAEELGIQDEASFVADLGGILSADKMALMEAEVAATPDSYNRVQLARVQQQAANQATYSAFGDYRQFLSEQQ